MLTKTLQSTNLPGTDITVTVNPVQINPLVYEFIAVVGQTTFSYRHTIGADGSGPVLDLPTLQGIVDGYCQDTADKAAWQENARILNDQLHQL